MVVPDTNSESEILVLREGSEDEVMAILLKIGERLNDNQAIQVLNNPNCTEPVIRTIYENENLLSHHKIQYLLVRHPHIPSAVSQRFIPLLYWKELLEIALNIKVPPVIRRNCEKYLKERIPGMGLGEKISLARRATQSLISTLRMEKHIKVIEALLDNPRMTENHIAVMANNSQTPTEVLMLIGNKSKWSSRYDIKLALIKNTQTPLGLALRLLKSLKRTDLQGLTRNPGIHTALKNAAKTILSR